MQQRDSVFLKAHLVVTETVTGTHTDPPAMRVNRTEGALRRPLTPTATATGTGPELTVGLTRKSSDQAGEHHDHAHQELACAGQVGARCAKGGCQDGQHGGTLVGASARDLVEVA